MALKLGKFGKFEIEKELGQGAMGDVYQARDPDLDRKVALKTVKPSLLKGKDTLARFKREARAAARLQHPNIVTIFEVGEVDDTRYIAKATGEYLRCLFDANHHVLGLKGQLTAELRWHWGIQTLLADLATLTKNCMRAKIDGAPSFAQYTMPTRLQKRAFQLLRVSPEKL